MKIEEYRGWEISEDKPVCYSKTAVVKKNGMLKPGVYDFCIVNDGFGVYTVYVSLPGDMDREDMESFYSLDEAITYAEYLINGHGPIRSMSIKAGKSSTIKPLSKENYRGYEYIKEGDYWIKKYPYIDDGEEMAQAGTIIRESDGHYTAQIGDWDVPEIIDTEEFDTLDEAIDYIDSEWDIWVEAVSENRKPKARKPVKSRSVKKAKPKAKPVKKPVRKKPVKKKTVAKAKPVKKKPAVKKAKPKARRVKK